MRLKLSYVRLLVADYAQAFSFYEHTLGLPRRFSDEASGYGEFSTGETILALFKGDAMLAALGGVGTPAVAGEQERIAVVFRVDDVDDTYRELAAKGVAFVSPPTNRPAWTVRTAHFRDLDGNLIEINGPLRRVA